MGTCSSSHHAAPDAPLSQLPTIIRVASSEPGQLRECELKPVLLLGAGEAGKSTIFKQLKLLYAHEQPYSNANAEEILHTNVLQLMQIALEHTNCDSAEFQDSKKIIMCLDPVSDRLNQDIINIFKDLLRNTPELRITIDGAPNQKRNYFFPDNADYFIKKLDCFVQDGYKLTTEDLLRLRQKTTGVYSQEFEVNSSKFQVTDVGGQRSERRKWLTQLKGNAGILFLFGASEFDQVLCEDEKSNRLQESLKLFAEVCKTQPFSDDDKGDENELSNVKIIVVFNKMDIFKEKIKKNSFRSLMKEFPPDRDECNEEEVIEYLKNVFLSKVGPQATRKYYFKTISAVNPEDVQDLFEWLTGVFNHSVDPILAPPTLQTVRGTSF